MSTIYHNAVGTATSSSVEAGETHDAQGSPAIASTCLMCGAGFTEKDLTELEWPTTDSPAHRACYLEYVDERNRFSDLLEEMRGA